MLLICKSRFKKDVWLRCDSRNTCHDIFYIRCINFVILFGCAIQLIFYMTTIVSVCSIDKIIKLLRFRNNDGMSLSI